VGTIDEAAAPAPALSIEGMQAIGSGPLTVRYRPGTVAETVAPSVLRRAASAMRRLGELAEGAEPTILLVDPFPDPNAPGQLLTHGTLVQPDAGRIWMVVTAEAPAEHPARPLAVLLGYRLPAGAELGALVEGYGLVIAEAEGTPSALAGIDLPPLSAAKGELRARMGASLARYLIDQADEDELRKFFLEVRPGRLDEAAEAHFGKSLTALEESWRQRLAAGGAPIRTARFLRLALQYVRPFAGRETENFLYMLIGLGFTVVFPFVFRRLIDVAIPSGHMSQVWVLIGILVVAFVISFLAGLRQNYLTAYVSSGIERELRREMFKNLQALGPRWFSQHQEGDLLSRLVSDVDMLEVGLSQALREAAAKGGPAPPGTG
jgi:hypothetical protein